LYNIRFAAKKRIGLYHFITDGNIKKLVLKSIPIPDGWRIGGVPTFTKQQTEEAKAKIANHENIKNITNYTNGLLI
jgi:O-succinylbenzoate synthase